jgi:hypothetical protein
MGRRPFSEDIDRCVHVPFVGYTTGAGPYTISQGDEGFEVATDTTEPGRGKEAKGRRTLIFFTEKLLIP